MTGCIPDPAEPGRTMCGRIDLELPAAITAKLPPCAKCGAAARRASELETAR